MSEPAAALWVGEARDERQLAAAVALRRTVFVEEQGVAEQIELDGRDRAAVHIVAEIAGEIAGEPHGQVVATARLLPDVPTAVIGRVAVVAGMRGRGLGRRVMAAAERAALARGASEVELHAQLAVEGFYRELGYEPVSGVYDEAGIPHRTMRKRLN